MVFHILLWFSYNLDQQNMVFLWFSYDFPINSPSKQLEHFGLPCPRLPISRAMARVQPSIPALRLRLWKKWSVEITAFIVTQWDFIVIQWDINIY